MLHIFIQLGQSVFSGSGCDMSEISSVMRFIGIEIIHVQGRQSSSAAEDMTAELRKDALRLMNTPCTHETNFFGFGSWSLYQLTHVGR